MRFEYALTFHAVGSCVLMSHFPDFPDTISTEAGLIYHSNLTALSPQIFFPEDKFRMIVSDEFPALFSYKKY